METSGWQVKIYQCSFYRNNKLCKKFSYSMLLILMTQLNDVSFMQMEFQIFKITFHNSITIRQLNIFFENLPYHILSNLIYILYLYTLSNLSRSNFFLIFHWKLCTCEVALFEKLEFNEEVLNLKLVVFLKAITEANIIYLSTLLHTFVKGYSFVMMQFKHILIHTKVQHQLRSTALGCQQALLKKKQFGHLLLC